MCFSQECNFGKRQESTCSSVKMEFFCIEGETVRSQLVVTPIEQHIYKNPKTRPNGSMYLKCYHSYYPSEIKALRQKPENEKCPGSAVLSEDRVIAMTPHNHQSDVRLLQKLCSPHILAEHRYQCEICPFGAWKQSRLKTHIDAVHEKKKNFVCKECGRAFAAKGGLQSHEKSVHENIKDKPCEICGKCFATRGGLKRHGRST